MNKGRFEQWLKQHSVCGISIGGWYDDKDPDRINADHHQNQGDDTSGGDDKDSSNGGNDLYTEIEKRVLSGENFELDDDGNPIISDKTDGDGKDGSDNDPSKTKSDGDYKTGGDDRLKTLEDENESLKAQIDEFKKSKEKDDSTKTDSDKGKGNTENADDRFSSVVEYEDKSNKFHGKTFKQIYDIDPDEAFRISPSLAQRLLLQERDEAKAAENAEIERRNQAQKEVDDFISILAKDTYGLDNKDKLDSEQGKAVEAILDRVHNWMRDNNKWGITPHDAYILMDHKNLIKKAESDAADKIVDAAQRGNVHNVKSKSDGDNGRKPSEDMSQWTENQLEAHLDSLSPAAFDKFLTEAPSALKKKFPDLPWN